MVIVKKQRKTDSFLVIVKLDAERRAVVKNHIRNDLGFLLCTVVDSRISHNGVFRSFRDVGLEFRIDGDTDIQNRIFCNFETFFRSIFRKYGCREKHNDQHETNC